MSRYALLMVAILLVGCSSGDASLDKWVEAIRTESVAPVESLPDWQPLDRYTYSAADRRSPFAPPDTADSVATHMKADIPELRATLQQFSIETMQMVGTLHINGRNYGLIRVPGGQIHRVEVGQIVGWAGARVTAIHEKEIRVTEMTSDGARRSVTQVTAISLRQ